MSKFKQAPSRRASRTDRRARRGDVPAPRAAAAAEEFTIAADSVSDPPSGDDGGQKHY